MVKSIVMHQLDYNEIAACEEWYYRCHGPQIARRYGPWLSRFESYRPVPLPKDFPEEELGYTNWLTTVGYWREVPLEGSRGEMVLSSPKIDARNFDAFVPPQWENDWKGEDFAPEEKACLRLLMFWQYPEGINKDAADAEFCEVLAKEIAGSDEVYRFFGSRAIADEIHLPGGWKADTMKRMMTEGPGQDSDHHWDRVTECWFETFDEVRAFFAGTKAFKKPFWAEQDAFPYLRPYEHSVSTFLLERPVYDWLQNFNVYR